MKTLSKVILVAALVGGFSQCANALEAGISGGMIDNSMVGGVYVKKGKYTIDGHVGGSENKNVKSIGVYREVLKLEDVGLSVDVGLSSNQSKTKLRNVNRVRTYQGYDVGVTYDFNNIKFRSTVNSNGDIKLGIGFEF